LLILASFLRILFAFDRTGRGSTPISLRPARSRNTGEVCHEQPLRNQHLVWNVGYSRALCHQQSVKLANLLVRYQQELPDKLDLGAGVL
jgi:hypothetical protein